MNNSQISRRHVLRLAAYAGGALGVPAFLAACGSDGGSSDETSPSSAPSGSSADTAAAASVAPATADYGSLSVALSWIKDVTFAGAFIADDKGYFAEQGFSSVDFVAGGGNSLPPTAQLLADEVQVAYSAPEPVADAVLQGGNVRIVGTLFQKNPLAVISLEKTPISSPAEMKGKRIGVFSGGEAGLGYFLTINGMSIDDVTTVPTNYDPLVLTTGDVDGYLGYAFDEPNTLKERGFPAVSMLYADFGYNSLAQAYAVRTSDLESNREMLKAYFVAEIAGWKENNASAAVGTDLVVSKYGVDAGLDAAHQVLQNESQIPLIATDASNPAGLLTITPEMVEMTIQSLTNGGVDVTADQIFDLTLLAEVYAEHPELLA